MSSLVSLRMLLTISLWCVYFFILVCYIDKFGIDIPSFVAIGLMVAELERHKTNMNTKEKHIIQSILKTNRLEDLLVGMTNSSQASILLLH